MMPRKIVQGYMLPGLSALQLEARKKGLGASDAEILRAVPGLTPADLEAAWEYGRANAEEIERAIRENEQGEEGLVE